MRKLLKIQEFEGNVPVNCYLSKAGGGSGGQSFLVKLAEVVGHDRRHPGPCLTRASGTAWTDGVPGRGHVLSSRHGRHLKRGGERLVRAWCLQISLILPVTVHCSVWRPRCWISCCHNPQYLQSRSCLVDCSGASSGFEVRHVSCPLPVHVQFHFRRTWCPPGTSSRCCG